MLILFLLLINEDTEEQRGEVIWPYNNRQAVAEQGFNSGNVVVDFVLKNKLKNDGESTFYRQIQTLIKKILYSVCYSAESELST